MLLMANDVPPRRGGFKLGKSSLFLDKGSAWINGSQSTTRTGLHTPTEARKMARAEQMRRRLQAQPPKRGKRTELEGLPSYQDRVTS